MAKTIAILLHETDSGFMKSNYLLRVLLRYWRRHRGMGVRVFRGVKRSVPADVIFPHVDLTVVPERYRRYLERYELIVNRAITDVSKSRISENLVRKGDAYAGPVIVKTDRNYGGMPERRLAALRRRATEKKEGKPATRAGLGQARWIATQNYPVYPSLAKVPPTVFANKELVVEKFLPEIDGEDYCLRYCYFLGDRDVSVRLRSRQKVIKGSKAISCEQVETPADCRAIRERMGFDFGKFDYVVRDGRTVLYDVSRTPAISTLVKHEGFNWVVPHLAEGIDSILARAEKTAG